MKDRRFESGDTLIEVMFAATVLALLIVLSVGIMNGGSKQAERAIEGTFVRQSIDSQSEMLRFARDAYVTGAPGGSELWKSITDHRISTPMSFADLVNQANCTPPGGQNAFWLATKSDAVSVQTAFTQPATYAAPGNGIWIEATPTDPTKTNNYVDFYIYACWDSPADGPKATTGTIVRLYAPAQ